MTAAGPSRGGAAADPAAQRDPGACDACLRRTALVAALAGRLDVEWRRRDERGPPQAGVAGAGVALGGRVGGGAARGTGGGHAAAARAAASSRRAAASVMCSGPTVELSSRSARVRATRSTRPWPRAERRWRSWSS